jgi:hydrogenase maturation protein HypF
VNEAALGSAAACDVDALDADALDADALDAAAASLLAGEIVALRGLGGFHLAVDATNSVAVSQLRLRKHREAKPLACMVATMDDAVRWAHLTRAERQMLASRERPIVLVTPRSDVRDRLADGLAPGLDRIGLMLPSTPLHLLLAQRVGRPLVMTSGNVSDEPLAAGNAEARERLAAIADAMLTHDREIVARIDDSVVRLAGDTPIMLRRARGYAPLSLTVPVASPVPVLAVGAHLKNTFTLLHQRQAFVSPHIGDLDSLETLTHWHAVLERYQSLYGVTPRVLASDLHDGYLSTRAAETLLGESAGMQLLRVQHHHAHIAAIAAEHGVDAPVLGVALDGTGAGTDGTAWGCEFLHADLTGFSRVGHLRPFVLAGGDLAVRSPWRSLLGLRALDADAFRGFPLETTNVSATEAQLAQRQIERSINAPVTSSAGRLFDAIASLLGLCHHARFEGEAAMRLEACAGRRSGNMLPFPVVVGDDGVRQLDPVPLLVALYEHRLAGVPVEQLAADAHDSIVNGLLTMIEQLADACGTNMVALGGGCFQNARLLESMTGRLRTIGLRPLIARELPANDGGVSYGQAAIAAACMAMGRHAPTTAEMFSMSVEYDRREVYSH